MKGRTVLQRIEHIVVEQLGVTASSLKPEARFKEDLGADSLDQIELLMAFEDEFGIDIEDESAEKIVTIGDAVAWVERMTGE